MAERAVSRDKSRPAVGLGAGLGGTRFRGVLLALALLAGGAGPAAQQARAAENCVTADCHAAFAKVERAHGPVHEGKCSPCHHQVDPKHPSASKGFRLVHGGGKDLCFSCHLDFGAGVANAKFFHRPVEQGDCEGCHVPHGAKEWGLVVRSYRTEITLPFALENHALCWDCHNQALVSLESTKRITEFRNGTRNLHWAHVNRATAGTGCRACHLTHASKFPALVRQVSAFADAWAPIREYTVSPTGGRCASNCHNTRGYDRDNPVTNF